jgi:arginase
MGPAALRLAGLIESLKEIVESVEDVGDIPVPPIVDGPSGFRHFGTFDAVAQALKRSVGDALDAGQTPVVLGGDHAIAVGSVSAAIERFPNDLAVLWIDAHADVNTPGTSPSGNLHGMPLGALQRLESGTTGTRDLQWRKLLTDVVPPTPLPADRIAWLGLRDIDKAESRSLLELKPQFVATMHDVDRFGVVEVMGRFDHWMQAGGATKLWVSFDVDCLDPVLAPGTGTAVRGGLTYRESHLFAELLREMLDSPLCPYGLVGLDVVETNPLLDTNNMTAVAAVEWIASLFGKTILGKR